MPKYVAKMKDSCHDYVLCSTSDFMEAIEACLRKVKESHASEAKITKEALTNRGYYCMGYSSREVYIEEEE